MLVCVPCKSTQVERRAIRESAYGAGARDVRLIEEPMAAAIGAGLSVEEASGSMVVDIGGGTTEIAIMSLNGVVYSDSVRIGGDRFDEAIVTYVRRTLRQPDRRRDGRAHQGGDRLRHGRQRAARDRRARAQPRRGRAAFSFTLNSDEILESLQEPLNIIVQAVKCALEQSPPELASDIAESGIVLTGGGALLRDIDRLIADETGLPVDRGR